MTIYVLDSRAKSHKGNEKLALESSKNHLNNFRELHNEIKDRWKKYERREFQFYLPHSKFI